MINMDTMGTAQEACTSMDRSAAIRMYGTGGLCKRGLIKPKNCREGLLNWPRITTDCIILSFLRMDQGHDGSGSGTMDRWWVQAMGP